MALGVKHPRYLVPMYSAQEWMDWRAYYRVNPWGPERDDVRAEIQRLRSLPVDSDHDFERPDWLYPYTKPAVDYEAVYQQQLDLHSRLEPDGKGGYRWIAGRKPAGLET